MNVILLIVAIVLVCLWLQAEINHRQTLRQFTVVYHRLNQLEPFIIQTMTVVNELQSDLLDTPATSETFGTVSLGELLDMMPAERTLVSVDSGQGTYDWPRVNSTFDQHTQDALHLVRGEN